MLDCLAGPFEPRCFVYELMPIFHSYQKLSTCTTEQIADQTGRDIQDLADWVYPTYLSMIPVLGA